MIRWNRRSFLRAGLLGAAGAALPRASGATRAPGRFPHRTLRKYRDPAPTVCAMCPARCGLVASRDADRVVQVLGSPGFPTNRGGVCARAYAGLERVYDPERVLQPLRRAGPRGSGRWEPLSWDDALGRVAEALGDGRRSVLHLGQDEFLVEELRPTLGWTEVLVDRRIPGRPGAGSQEDLYGAPVLGPDLRRARTVYLFGVRPVDGRFRVPQARDLVDARARGTRVHLFHPVAGATAGLGGWTPVPPGAEGAVALGMARVLLEEGAVGPERWPQTLSDTPADLLDALAPYAPEAAAAATGVPPETLRRLARAFARQGPALALGAPGTPAAVGAALLNHLAGSINRPGGIQTARGPYFTRPIRPAESPARWLRGLAEGAGERVDLYWAADANPAYDAPEARRVARALADPDRVGLLVVMDTHLTETALLADIFLPLATSFECWSLVEGCLPDGRPYLALQQPVTRPDSEAGKLRGADTEHLALFEPRARPRGRARGLADALLALARIRDPEGIPYARVWDVLDVLLRKSWGPGSLQALTERGIWVAEEPKAPDPVRPVALAGAIPPPPEEPPGELLLVAEAPPTLARTFANDRWGREIAHRQEAFLHPAAARRLGLRSGDRALIRTRTGEARVRVRVLQGVHPRAVVLPDGFGHRAGGSVATLEGAGADVWWARHGPGASARELVPLDRERPPVPVEVRRAP